MRAAVEKAFHSGSHLLLATLLGLWACGSGDDRPPPAEIPEGGSGGSTGGRNSSQISGGRGGSTSSDAGQAGDGVPGGGVPSFPEPSCDPEAQYGDAREVEVAADGDLTLLSITPDGLSVAFTRDSSSSPAGLVVSDREAVDRGFPEGTALELPEEYSAELGAALSSDGLRLIVTRVDGMGLAQLSRRSRAVAFGGEPDPEPFQIVQATLAMSSGAQSGYPVLSPQDDSLYFVRLLAGSLVMVSTLVDGAYDFPLAIDEFTLGGSDDDGQKFLSGLSSDARTIYLFDEADSRSYALFRSRPDGPFYDPKDFGQRRGLAPNQDCSVLYSSMRVDGATRIVEQRLCTKGDCP